MKAGSLFSGIGGFDLGLVRAGMEIAWQVEIDEFCRKVLAKHAPEYWPNAERFNDVKEVSKEQLKPHWIIGENVAGFINMELENAFTDLETEGYKVEAFVLPAYGVGAFHRRDRIYIVAYRKSKYSEWSLSTRNRFGQSKNAVGNGHNDLRKSIFEWQSKPPVCGVSNGIPNRVDRLRSLGNAVVPQIVQIIGEFIIQAELHL